MSIEKEKIFIAIIGSGPIGLECALQSFQRGFSFLLFESADDIAENVRLWSHVRLFSPTNLNLSSRAKSLLNIVDDRSNEYLTGGEYREKYLRPISETFSSKIRFGHRIVSIGRHSSGKFLLFIEKRNDQSEEFLLADVVIDTSGTYSNPNYGGPSYLPAINERMIRTTMPHLITSFIPDFSREFQEKKRILLLGKGYSAATSAVALAQWKENHPDVELFWLIKQSIVTLPFCTNVDDPLKYRQELSMKANEIYSNGKVFTKIFLQSSMKKLTLSSNGTFLDVTIETKTFDEEILRNIDLIISNTGAQPDRNLYANLNVHECYRSKGPMNLAMKLFSSGSNDCLKETSHGASSLITTEKNFFILGNKSYGKQTNFLLRIGFEQVNEVFQLINEFQDESPTIYSNSSC